MKRNIKLATNKVKESTEQDFMKEVSELSELAEKAKDLGNAKNRQATVVRNLFKKLIGEKGYTEAEGKVAFNGLEYFMSAGETEKLDPRLTWEAAISANYGSEEFLKLTSVNKAAAIILFGADIVAGLTVTTPGKTLALRTKDTESDINKDKVEVYSSKPPPKFKKKKGRVIKRRLKI